MFQPSQRGMRPLSVLRTSFPIKGQEAVVAWTFSLGLSALAFPAPSRGRMPARQEGVFTKRLSDKQYIMKAESLLEHKCFFSGFCFYLTAIIHLRYLSEAYINGKYRSWKKLSISGIQFCVESNLILIYKGLSEYFSCSLDGAYELSQQYATSLSCGELQVPSRGLHDSQA